LTLSATATVTGSASLAATIGSLSLAATIAVIDSASLAAAIGPITLVANDQDVIAAVVDATLGAIILTATVTAAAAHSRDGVYPWWWQYKARIEAEREAAKKQWLENHAIEGDGVGVMRAFTGHGEATHSQLDPDEADAAAIAAAALWLLVA
jgi:hypothetical protein